jgi:hypothetical protein
MGSAGLAARTPPALAALWLLGAVLQFQTFMCSQGFPMMLAATAAGNPGPAAAPLTWSAHQVLCGRRRGGVTRPGRPPRAAWAPRRARAVLHGHGVQADLDALTAASP